MWASGAWPFAHAAVLLLWLAAAAAQGAADERGLAGVPNAADGICEILEEPPEGLVLLQVGAKFKGLVHASAAPPPRSRGGPFAGLEPVAIAHAATNKEAGDLFLATPPKIFRAKTEAETGYRFGIHDEDFTAWDFRNYLLQLWHPGAPRGTSCATLERFGNDGDGGKMVCDAAQVLHARKDCLVVSVGSNGDVSFESRIRSINPSCEVHIYDPTLSAEKAARIPKWATFFSEPFSAATALKPAYQGRSISILKIDCEGCEFDSMGSWIAHTCTDLVIPEVHAWTPADDARTRVRQRMTRTHTFMSMLEDHGYRVYSSEVNLLTAEGTNVEYGLKRMASCPAS